MGRSATQPQLADFDVELDGASLDASVKAEVKELRIVDHLRLPDTCQIRFEDRGMKLADDVKWKPGAKLKVKLKGTNSAQGANTLQPIFDGFIVAIEPEFSKAGAAIFTVRAYDNSYKLHAARTTQVYADMTVGDIVRKICGRTGFSPQLDESKLTFKRPYTHQSHETDWQFLWRLAASVDYEVVVIEGTKLAFRPAGAPSGSQPIELEYGQSLSAFRPRITGVQAVKEVEVRTWDLKSAAAIVATKSAQEPQTKPGLKRPQVLSAMQGVGASAAKVTISNRPAFTQGEADALAQNTVNRAANAFADAEGHCDGHPQVKAGSTVKIKGVGTRFGGEWVVTTSTHVLRGTHGYETIFSVTGRSSRTMVDLVNPAEPQHFADHLVVGVVTNLDDPDKLGRIKVKYPTLGANPEQESYWARLVFAHAGFTKNRGIYISPQVGDEVVIGFEHGDMARPYVIGSVYNGKSKLEAPGGPGNLPGKLGRKDGSLAISTPKSVAMDVGEDHVAKTGKTYKLEVGTDMEIIIQGKKKEDGKSDITSKAQANYKMEAGARFDIKGGSQVTIESTGQLTLKGQMVKIEGAQVEIQGQAMVKVSAPQVMLG